MSDTNKQEPHDDLDLDDLDLNALKQRLDKASQELQPKYNKPKKTVASMSGMGVGMSIAIEMLVALLVGVGIGLLLDNWLNTKPWFLILFCFFGMGAAISNAIRKGKDYDAQIKRKREANAQAQQGAQQD